MHVRLYTSIVGLWLLFAVTGCGTSGNSSSSESSNNVSPQQWLTSNTSQKTADVKLVANYNNTDGGMNFDGYSNGDMTITIPQGWRVQVYFSNASTMNVHSAMIIPYSERINSSFSPSMLAFAGASTPNPDLGTPSRQNQTFAFTPNKVGKYAIICGIPGHAAMGMWDTLIVSDSHSQPSVSAK